MKRTQYEVENELRDCFKHNKLREVSLESGISYNILERGINPGTLYESAAYQLLKVQVALDAKDPEEGERHWQIITRMRNECLPGADNSERGQILEFVETAESNLRVIKSIAEKLPKVREQCAEIVREYRRGK